MNIAAIWTNLSVVRVSVFIVRSPTKLDWSGATPSCVLGRGPRLAAQRQSLSEATTNTPAPVRIAYWALGFLFMALVALVLIEARYSYGVAFGSQTQHRREIGVLILT
jgi:hypothetical protein